MERRFDEVISNASQFVVEHAPEILTGMGITGMATAGVLAVRATPKAMERVKEEKLRLGKTKLSPLETVRTTWTLYLLPLGLGLLGAIGCVSSTSISTKRNATLAAALTISETALKTYSSKVVETIGEKKDREIRESIIQDKIEEEERKPQRKRIYDTGKGKTHCILMWNMVEFYSDIDKVKMAIAKLNETLAYDNEVSLNDLYSALGLYELDTCQEGNQLGWDIEHGRIECDYKPYRNLSSDGEPMLAVAFKVGSLPRPLGMPWVG